MYDEYLKLLLYSNIDKDSVFMGICDIYKDWKNGFENKNELIHRVYTEIKKLLDVSTELGFDGNLWHNYIAYLIMTNENSFSLTCERLAVTRRDGQEPGSRRHCMLQIRISSFL